MFVSARVFVFVCLFFCQTFGAFLNLVFKYQSLGSRFGGGRSDSHICQFIDKILATRLLMSYFDELPRAFLNTLLQSSLTFIGGVIDPPEIG